jgi:hypothetical protein
MAYNVWRSMHKRCKDPRTNGYRNYGGRGISVCNRWNTYEYFISDMGSRPSPKHQLDRIDNNGNYEPSNCRWVTASENERNKPRTKLIEWEGQIKTAKEWSNELGFAHSTFVNRLKNWGIEKAFTEPHGPTGPKKRS